MRQDERLLSALRERLASGNPNPSASPSSILRAESQLGVLCYVGEVGNGGHTQFFSNRGGDVATRVHAALQDVALIELRTVLESAIAIFPDGSVPTERSEVDRLIDALTEDRLEAFDRLDKQAWNLDVYPRLLEFMREHESDLPRPERGLDVVRSAR